MKPNYTRLNEQSAFILMGFEKLRLTYEIVICDLKEGLGEVTKKRLPILNDHVLDALKKTDSFTGAVFNMSTCARENRGIVIPPKKFNAMKFRQSVRDEREEIVRLCAHDMRTSINLLVCCIDTLKDMHRIDKRMVDEEFLLNLSNAALNMWEELALIKSILLEWSYCLHWEIKQK